MNIDKDDSLFVGLVPGMRGRAWSEERATIEAMEVGDVLHGANVHHVKAVANIRQLRNGKRFITVTRDGVIHIKRVS